MRLILSRKGFDSAAGGGPSPILPDGSFLSLPIPQKNGVRLYSELRSPFGAFDRVIAELHGDRGALPDRAHLDPDLNAAACPRPRGWVPAFGQDAAAASHLDNQGVREGDLFVFFGWFRQTEQHAGRLRFVKAAPDLHVCFGWLRVGRILRTPIPGLEEHPHFRPPRYATNSRVYAARSRSEGGLFKSYQPQHRLTRTGSTLRSHWELPTCFRPAANRTPLSYHGNRDRWTVTRERCLLRTVGRGQEFVIRVAEHPGVMDWAVRLGVRPSNGETPRLT